MSLVLCVVLKQIRIYVNVKPKSESHKISLMNFLPEIVQHVKKLNSTSSEAVYHSCFIPSFEKKILLFT